MYRTPPRRSSRLNPQGELPPVTSQSNMTENSVVFTPITEEPVGANTFTVPAMDTTAAVTAHIYIAEPASDSNATGGPSNSISSMSANRAFDFHAMEQRLALLEAHLQATQVQLRDRDHQNDALRAALFRNGGCSAVTYASSVVSQSQLPPPQPQLPPPQPQPQLPPTRSTLAPPLVAEQSGVYSSTSLPFTEVRYSSEAHPVICSTMPTANNLYSAPYTNGAYSSFASHSPNLSVPPTSVSAGYNHSMPYSPNTTFMPRKLLDLPEFSGRPEDWPVFYTAFNESTAAYG